MAEWSPLVTDRPLTAADPVRLSRYSDIDRLKGTIAAGPRIVFLWTPSKAGMTTFTNELLERVRQNGFDAGPFYPEYVDPLAPCASFDQWASDHCVARPLVILRDFPDQNDPEKGARCIRAFVTRYPTVTVLVPGRVQLFNSLETHEPPRFTHLPFPDFPGDPVEFATFSRAPNERGEICIAEFSLSRFPTGIVVDHFATLLAAAGASFENDSLHRLCDALAGHLYLLQAYLTELLRSREGLTSTAAACDRIAASECVRSYFSDLTTEVFRAPRNQYYLAHYVHRRRLRARTALHGLNFVTKEGDGFETPLIESFFHDTFTPETVLRAYFAEADWLTALSVARMLLASDHDVTSGTHYDRHAVLAMALSAAARAHDSGALRRFGLAYQQLHSRPERAAWRSNGLPDLMTELLGRGTHEPRPGQLALPPEVILDVVAAAVDIAAADADAPIAVAATTGRGRIYLLDSSGQRLICHEAWGEYANEWRRTPVEVNDRKWKLISALEQAVKSSIDFLSVRSTTEVQCHEIASRRELDTCWLFSIGIGDECIGILCVDNPPDVDDDSSPTAIRAILSRSLPALRHAHRIIQQQELGSVLRNALDLGRYAGETPFREPPDTVALCRRLGNMVKALEPSIANVTMHVVSGFATRVYRLIYSDFPEPGWPTNRYVPESSIRFDGDTDYVLYRCDPRLQEHDALPADVVTVLGPQRASAIGYLLRVPFRQVISLPGLAGREPGQVLGYCDFFTDFGTTLEQRTVEIVGALVTCFALSAQSRHALYRQYLYHRGVHLLDKALSDILSGASTSKEAVNRATFQLAELFDADLATYFSVNPDTHTCTIASACSSSEGVIALAPETLKNGAGLAEAAVAEKAATLWYAALSPPGSPSPTLLEGSETALSVPIMAVQNGSEEVVAAFGLESKKPFAFPPDALELVQTIASQIRLAGTVADLLRSAAESTRIPRRSAIDLSSRIDDEFEMFAQLKHRYAPPLRLASAAAGLATQHLEPLLDQFSGTQRDDVGEILANIELCEHVLTAGAQQLTDLITCLRRPVDITRINLLALITEIASAYAVEGGRTCTIAVDERVHIESSKPHVRLLLEHLITNAAEHTDSPDGQVEITAEDRADGISHFVTLVLRNNGPPMTADMIARYEDGRPIISEKRGGPLSVRGMGLWIAKRSGHRILAVPQPHVDVTSPLPNKWTIPFPRQLHPGARYTHIQTP